jgi:hypothetical protein
VRLRCRPRWSICAVAIVAALMLLAAAAVLDGAPAAAGVLGALGLGLALRMLIEGASAMSATVRAFEEEPWPS